MGQSVNMVRLSDMVRIGVPGALDGIIRLESFNVLKEFFQRTNAWLFELPIYIEPVVNDYRLETGQNCAVNRLMTLGRPQTPPDSTQVPMAYAPMCPPQFLTSYEGGQTYEGQNPLFRTQRDGFLLNAGSKHPILRIGQNPGAAEVWIATLALTPTDPVDSNGFVDPPDWVMEKYLRSIASGVMSALMLQPGKSYSSLPGAQYHGRKFNEGIGQCRTEVRQMFGYSVQRWAFPGGWNMPRPRLPSSGSAE